MRHYHVNWSEEDQQYVATVNEYPSISWLADSELESLTGLKLLIDSILAEDDDV